MIALLPVSRYRVSYDIGSGRPYGELEALALAALGSGEGTVEGLSTSFRVHPRLIIESLITLIHAGWIALGGEDRHGYVLTPEGRAALRESSLPPSVEVARDLTAVVVMERVYGLVAPSTEVDYQTEYQLKRRGLWDHCVQIRPRFYSNRIDEGQVQHLLYRPEDHWLERVGPIIHESKHWAPVTVDLDHRVVHLPTSRWNGPLADNILEEVEASDRTADIAARRQVWSRRRTEDVDAARTRVEHWPTVVSADDILVNGHAHLRYMRSALARASGAVLICSAFMTVAAIDSLQSDLTAALERDVDIDVLWGYEAEEGLALDRLKKLAYDAGSAPGKLRFNRDRTHSHAKVLIWQEEVAVHAVVGSCALYAGVLEARSRLTVASHRLGPPAAIRLRGLTSGSAARQVEVRYGDSADSAAKDAVADLCRASGAELRHLPHQHAKFVLADDTAVVGSYNFLAADPYGTAERARELSVELVGPGASLIWDAVRTHVPSVVL